MHFCIIHNMKVEYMYSVVLSLGLTSSRRTYDITAPYVCKNKVKNFSFTLSIKEIFIKIDHCYLLNIFDKSFIVTRLASH